MAGQAGLVLVQLTAGEAEISGAVGGGGDAGARAGGVIRDGHVGIGLVEGLNQGGHHALHGGGAVGGHAAGQVGGGSVLSRILGGGIVGSGGVIRRSVVRGGGVVGRSVVRGLIVAVAAAGNQGERHDQSQEQGKNSLHDSIILRFICFPVISDRASIVAGRHVRYHHRFVKPLYVFGLAL